MNRFLISAITLLIPILIIAQESEKDQAIVMVTSAETLFKTKGEAEAVRVINDSTGPFVKGELYVFAYDTLGAMKAHPKNAKLVGKNLIDVPDVDGKLFRKEIIQIALSSGKGWVDYKYKNPVSGKIEEKTTYVVRAGTLVLCCGIYK